MASAPAESDTHAVVLAGGAGTRMPPLPSPTAPKALLPIANTPLLHYTLHSLVQSSILSATIVVDPLHESDISASVTAFTTNPSLPPTSFTVHARNPDAAGTADALRDLPLPPAATDLLVLSCDTVSDARLDSLVAHHRETGASLTAAFHRAAAPPAPPPVPAKGKKPAKKKAPPVNSYKPSLYVVTTPSNQRVLSVCTPSDLSANAHPIRSPLLARYDCLHLRSDLVDPHVYVLHRSIIEAVLDDVPAVSSIKYDLLPYLARRQHTLTRRARRKVWNHPGEDVRVQAFVLEENVYAKRANTVEQFLQTNLDVAAGRLAVWFGQETDAKDKKKDGKEGKKDAPKKKGKPPAKPLPFTEVGERVSVTPDSCVGKDASAGDRVSVKKSVVGHRCKLESGVKVNGSVLMDGVVVGEGANLAACVVCDGATIGKGCVLKDCRIAAGVSVPEGTEESGREFLAGADADDGDDEGFEFF